MKLAAAIAAALVTLLLVIPAELHTEHAMLVLGRFVPGGAWIEGAVLAAYAAFLGHRLMDPQEHARWRPWLWRFFSEVFFGQLTHGLVQV